MKVGVLHIWDERLERLAELVVPNTRRYCRRWGYELVTARRRMVGRDPQWLKVAALQGHLPRFDWLLYLDIDLAVLNHAIRLEPFLGARDLLATYDHNGLNTGVLLFRNCEWSIGFLAKWWEEGKRYQHYPNSEQTSLAYLLYREPRSAYEVVCQKGMNSYLYSLYPGVEFPAGNYEPGDFALHVPGLAVEEKIRVLGEYLRGCSSNEAEKSGVEK
jgi:hypothetical protein